MKNMTLQEKKEEKEGRLLDSAYSLFARNGFASTSIDDIVKKAEVAKGTFYLYFKDKEDLLDRLTARTSYQYISHAFDQVKKQNLDTFQDRCHAFINELIDQFKTHKQALRFLRHNFCWPMAIREMDLHGSEQIESMFDEFMENCPYLKNHTREEGKQLLYLIIEMIGNACYNAIIRNEPAPIEEIRPMILAMTDRMLS